MTLKIRCVVLLLAVMDQRGSECVLLAPEDVPMGLAVVYGFSPFIRAGQDNRLGFGFSFGNFADFQITYELGPQIYTKPLQPIRARSPPAARVVRRRPFIELLVRAGILQETPQYDIYEPR